MRKCPACGTHLLDDREVCPLCGTRVVPEESPAPMTSETMPDSSASANASARWPSVAPTAVAAPARARRRLSWWQFALGLVPALGPSLLMIYRWAGYLTAPPAPASQGHHGVGAFIAVIALMPAR